MIHLLRTSGPLLLVAALALPNLTLAQPLRVGGEFQVNTVAGAPQGNPSLGTDADGDFVVAWQSYHDGSNSGVFAQRFSSAGDALAAEFQVNSYTAGFQFAPSVAVEADGDFVVAWVSRDQDGSIDGIFASRFSSTGTLLASEFSVNSFTANGQQYPSVASDADGDFVVVWESATGQDGANYGVFGQRFSSEGAALGAEFQVNTFTLSDQRAVSASAEDAGGFVVAWHSRNQDADGYGIFAQRFDSSGAAQAVEFQVNTHTESYQGDPAVATATGGAFVVAWYSYLQDGSTDGAFGQLFGSDGTPLAAEFQVNVHTANAQNQTSVAASADGFVVAWRSILQDGEGAGVFARLVSSAGAPLASEFQVNTHTASEQYRPGVAAGVEGDFVVAWQSYGQDGSGAGVFAQRFAAGITLDIDGDGAVEPLTDGLLVLRYLFGFTGATLTSGAVDTVSCDRCDATTIEPYLGGLGLTLDIDDDTQTEALTDGLLVLRYLFGFTGATLTNGAVDTGSCGERCDATTIEPYLAGLT